MMGNISVQRLTREQKESEKKIAQNGERTSKV